MTEVWGPLAKAQTDPTTIDEAIAAAIANHEEDADAHLGSGQSLQSHKASEIIDHLAGSIVADKFSDKEFVCRTGFDSLSRWVKVGGENSLTWPGFELYPTWGGPNPCYMRAYLHPFTGQLSSSYNFMWQTLLAFNFSASQGDISCFVGMGYSNGGAPSEYLGVRYDGLELTGVVVHTGGTSTVQLSAAYDAENHVLKMLYDKTVKTAYFFIDGVQAGSINIGTHTFSFTPYFLYYGKLNANEELSILGFDLLIGAKF